jgi:dynein heavy chain
MVDGIFTSTLLSDDQLPLSTSGIYHTLGALGTRTANDSPGGSDTAGAHLFAHCIDYVNQLPDHASPEVIGLHSNSQLVASTAAMDLLFSTASTVGAGRKAQGVGAASGDVSGTSFGQDLLETMRTMSIELPPQFDCAHPSLAVPSSVSTAKEGGATVEVDALTTVLAQELRRFNVLTTAMKHTLEQLPMAMAGQAFMSDELERTLSELHANEVPLSWAQHCYTTHTPLGAWYKDLLSRIEFFGTWLSGGSVPTAMWFSAFFWPQALLTGIKQNFARRQNCAGGGAGTVDELTWKWTMCAAQTAEDIIERPAGFSGEYIHGLFMEGARWAPSSEIDGAGGVVGTLVEPAPKELFSPMPVILAEPRAAPPPLDATSSTCAQQGGGRSASSSHTYHCPVYAVPSRGTSFIVAIDIPTSVHPDRWIKAGAACICSHRL